MMCSVFNVFDVSVLLAPRRWIISCTCAEGTMASPLSAPSSVTIPRPMCEYHVIYTW